MLDMLPLRDSWLCGKLNVVLSLPEARGLLDSLCVPPLYDDRLSGPLLLPWTIMMLLPPPLLTA